MHEIEQTLDSREVADMVEKDHNKLLREIRRYVEQLGETKIGHFYLTNPKLAWLKST